MATFEREKMITDLKGSVVNVTFTKSNGNERKMACTLIESYLPEMAGSSSERPVNLDVIPVWDIENDGWRSFRVNSVTEFSVAQSL